MKNISDYKRTFLRIIKFSLVIIVAFNLVNCTKEPSFRESLIKVDSISIDRILSNHDPISIINLHGIIGIDDCSSLSYVKTSYQIPELIIEAWKKTPTAATVCPTMILYLDHQIVLDKFSFVSVVKVRQPDGSFLEKSIQK